MKEEGYSQGRMSRETGLSYNTVKAYLRRMEGGQGSVASSFSADGARRG